MLASKIGHRTDRDKIARGVTEAVAMNQGVGVRPCRVFVEKAGASEADTTDDIPPDII